MPMIGVRLRIGRAGSEAGGLNYDDFGAHEVDTMGGLVVLFLDEIKPLLHELHGADAITLEGADIAAAAAMVAAIELAGDDEAVVLVVDEGPGRRLQQAPVLIVDGDDGEERVQGRRRRET